MRSDLIFEDQFCIHTILHLLMYICTCFTLYILPGVIKKNKKQKIFAQKTKLVLCPTSNAQPKLKNTHDTQQTQRMDK